MKRGVLLCLVLLCILIAVPSMYSERFIVNTAIPIHNDPSLDTSKEAQDTLAALQASGTIVKALPRFNMVILDTSTLSVSSLSSQEMITSLNRPETIHVALAQTIPIINGTATHQTQIGGVNVTGSGQRVCVLDTGINSSHADFGSRIVQEHCICSVGGACCPNGNSTGTGPGSAEDDHGHGTHVAGIIGADGTVRGIAPNVSLVIVKMMNSAGSGNTADLYMAMDYCLEQNTTSIGMSLSTQTVEFSSQGTCDSFDGSSGLAPFAEVVANGTLPVVASGNDGFTNGLGWPSCLVNATAVGSTTDADGISSFTNRKVPMLDLLAPGSTVYSTSFTGGHTTLSGTSQATPHVAGAAALLQQVSLLRNNITLGALEMQDILNRTGVPVSSWTRIDVKEAIDSILPIQNNSINNSVARINFSTALAGKEAQKNIRLGNGFVSVNSQAQPLLDTSATIVFENVSCPISTIVIADGFFGTKEAVQANGRTCPDDVCTDISCVGSTLTFSVSGFSGFAAGGNANLTINDSFENQTIEYQNPAEFFAYYVNATSGALITGASCNASFDDGQTIPMVESASYYSINKTYFVGGTRNWNVTCAATGFTQLTAQDTIEVNAPVPEFSDLLWLGLIGVFIGIFVFRKNAQ